jgi:hypothetical protein
MTSIIAAMQDSLLLIESSKSGWKSHESLKGNHPQCVTFDTQNPNHVYCETFGKSDRTFYEKRGHTYSQQAVIMSCTLLIQILPDYGRR